MLAKFWFICSFYFLGTQLFKDFKNVANSRIEILSGTESYSEKEHNSKLSDIQIFLSLLRPYSRKGINALNFSLLNRASNFKEVIIIMSKFDCERLAFLRNLRGFLKGTNISVAASKMLVMPDGLLQDLGISELRSEDTNNQFA